MDSLGTGVLIEEDANQYVCTSYPVENSPSEIPLFLDPANIPSLSTIQNLQSKPGATKILYIDPWGGTLTGSAWNSTSGNPTITYDAYTQDASASFNDTERYEIYHAWLEATEDYAPFDINVTTKTSVFTAASNANKSRIISTTNATRDSQGICGSCGGVAYVGQYGGNILYQTGWTFNSSIGSTGMTHSHEAGHQMGLGHDGGSANPSYYSGHGVWGPIMGAPFGKQYVQWSKGDYPGANNFQDDFAVIAGKLNVSPDLEGWNTGAGDNQLGLTDNYYAMHKVVPKGVPGFAPLDGLSDDGDAFFFTVPPAGGDIDLKITPRAGADTMNSPIGEARASNLSFNLGLHAHPYPGFSIASVSSSTFSPLRPNTNKLDYTGSLDGGEYLFKVYPTSPDSSWTTGFDNWGNGGEYVVDFNLDFQHPFAECGNITGANHTFIFNNNGFDSTERDLFIGTTSGTSDLYSSAILRGDAANDTRHHVTNLPVDGSNLYLTLYSKIDGLLKSEQTTCVAASGGEPAVYAPLPGSIITGSYSTSGTSEFIKWKSNGLTVTNYWLYAGSGLGGRNHFNSGDLGTDLEDYVTGIPSDGRTVYVRLWYSTNNGVDWNYNDVTYRSRNNDNGPYLTDPAPGAALGEGIHVNWTDAGPNATSDRYRVYAGPTKGSAAWTYSGNILSDKRSFYIGGWAPADYGKTIWVRFLWRKDGVWRRQNYSYVAGFGPATIDAENTRPVPVGQ